MASSSSSSSAASAAAEEGRAEELALTGLLSDDTLLHVMRRLSTRELLSSVAFVCRRWRRLCTSFSVYELVPCPLNTSRNPWGRLRRKRLLQLAAIHTLTLERVHLHGLTQVKVKDVIALCQSLPKLHDLSIEPCSDLGTTGLELIANQLPTELTSLDLIAFPNSVNDKILADIHQRCPKLQKLNFDVISDFTRQGLNGLLQACQSLTSLDLNSSLLGWPEVAQVFECCKSLRHFSLVSPLLKPTSGSRDDSEIMGGIFQIYTRGGQHWGRDRSQVSTAISLGVDMPRHLTSIRLYISMRRSVQFELPPMQGLLRSNGHQLQQLYAQGVFNTSWQPISVWCANLKLLDLTHVRQNSFILTEVEEVVLCGLIQLLKKLEHIALPSATDHILTYSGRFCPNLREIRFLDLGKNTFVTDRGVVAVAEGCPDLRVLSLPGCHNVTISSARALAFHCRQLKVLLFSMCTKFTDAAVVALLPRLSRSLVFLDLLGCDITQSTLEAIRQYAKVTSLRLVAVGRHLWVRSHSVIAEIHSCNPRLRIRHESGIVWDGFYHGTVFD